MNSHDKNTPPRSGGLETSAGRPRILVVDASGIITRAIRQTLESLGYENVAEATSASEALTICQGFRPDLLIVDAALGGNLRGVELARELCREGLTPVIFLSTFLSEEVFRRLEHPGAVSYIPKPFGDEELSLAVHSMLAESPSGF